MKRRAWLTLAGAAAASVPLGLLYQSWRRSRSGSPHPALTQRSGPLQLRAGFHCHVLAKAGDRLSDGSRSAEAPDGMACFSGEREGEVILLRNHELHTEPARGAFPQNTPPEAYDPAMHGGVSRLVVRESDLKLVSSNSVLTGTARNCAGGPSPWGWLTCEEAEDEGHGYVFACPADADKLRPPHKIPGYGRFRHEAVAIAPGTLNAYLTEDQFEGALYRFTPHSPESPFEGQLWALRIPATPGVDTTELLSPGERVTVDWVKIPDAEARTKSTREQALAAGAALFARGEGIFMDQGSVVFSATAGGPVGLGQIFRLHLGKDGKDQLELLTQAEDAELLRGPDNLTVAPWGDVVIAEDGPDDQHIWGLTPQGQLYPIARNVASTSEIAGVCFSPSGRTLFCNLQREGWTLAITGPWESLRA